MGVIGDSSGVCAGDALIGFVSSASCAVGGVAEFEDEIELSDAKEMS